VAVQNVLSPGFQLPLRNLLLQQRPFLSIKPTSVFAHQQVYCLPQSKTTCRTLSRATYASHIPPHATQNAFYSQPSIASMPYKSLRHCLTDLERNGHLLRLSQELDPDLVIPEIHRRVFQAQGPAILYENVKGSPFPAVSNLFGTLERSRYIFRDTLERVQRIIELKADPPAFLKSAAKKPAQLLDLAKAGLTSLPKKVRSGPALANETTIDQLPQIKCWPNDGGPFILLPQVYTEDPLNPGILKSNLGMYRIQLAGNDYDTNKEIGLHYQIRRDIGIHHTNAIEKGEPLRVSIFVGGPPAHTFAAVMPLPEDLPEVAFAGALAGRRFRYAVKNQGPQTTDKTKNLASTGNRTLATGHSHIISTDADFVITGTVVPGQTKPEGPFGDHLGYYSLAHDFPVLQVEHVYHRNDAVWPFTVVGRPPQEDTAFGHLIHEITGPMVPVSLPGVKEINAVDTAGVHPLLLAIGSERYVPYLERQPREILTIANAILGFGACSLAKYLIIAASEDDPGLDTHHIDRFLQHVLERVDWTRDLHFQTRTTIDTLDYSGTGLNEGSKVVIAAAGNKKRDLAKEVPSNLPLPEGFRNPTVALPGILALEAPQYTDPTAAAQHVSQLTDALESGSTQTTAETLAGYPLIILVDDSAFTARTLNNLLWTTFTRSNPSHDIHGLHSFTEHKHWGCHGSLVIDARLKPHHAPPLVEDPAVTAKVDQLASPGGPLHGVI
jgi:4-hydroxy-3-polyprenylbenzoate decarboxylase